MELCDLNLATFIAREWSPSIQRDATPAGASVMPNERMEQVRNIMKDILNGVEFIHSRNEVHRDLKPQNGSLG